MASKKKKLIVLAIGGNSLIADAKHRSVADQYAACLKTCRHIVPLLQKGYRVVITHGNGPQVGFILRRSELAAHELHIVPLDSCGADSQGGIGYQLQQAIHNCTRDWPQPAPVATVITRTLVDANDPAFSKPSKPIGSFMDAETAQVRRDKEGWTTVEDAGRGFRRVVASPRPIEILEFDAIRRLIESDFVVVAVGGGGIPVAVERVCLNFGKPDQRALDRMTVAEARQYMGEGHFAPGSMLPKIEAIVEFLEAGGREALVTDPPNLARAIAGETGTRVVRA
jgi:carbamate kinase